MHVLVEEVGNDLKSQFPVTEMECCLKVLATTLCCEGKTLTDIVEYHCNLFVELYGQRNKVSFAQFQIDWQKYCSAFLLEDGLSLQAIGIEKDHSVSEFCQVRVKFCAANNTPVPISNRVVITISSGVYTALLQIINTLLALKHSLH